MELKRIISIFLNEISNYRNYYLTSSMKLNSSALFEVKSLGAELDPLASFVNGSDVSKNQLLKFHVVEPIRIDRDAIVRGCQCNSSSTIMCHIYMIGWVLVCLLAAFGFMFLYKKIKKRGKKVNKNVRFYF